MRVLQYLHFCYEDQRPYIAMNMHGDRLVVDLAPVEGLGGFKDASRMDDMEDLFSEVLEGHWIKHFQIVNAVSEDQVRSGCGPRFVSQQYGSPARSGFTDG